MLQDVVAAQRIRVIKVVALLLLYLKIALNLILMFLVHEVNAVDTTATKTTVDVVLMHEKLL